MDRLLLSVRCLLLLLGILSLRSLQAQDIRSQEIIIQRDGDRENRISIEVIGDSVWVNGKPMDKDSMDGFFFRKRSKSSSISQNHPPSTGIFHILDAHTLLKLHIRRFRVAGNLE